MWILQKQETVSGSGISRAVCKSARRSRQITMPASHHSVFTGRVLFLRSNSVIALEAITTTITTKRNDLLVKLVDQDYRSEFKVSGEKCSVRLYWKE